MATTITTICPHTFNSIPILGRGENKNELGVVTQKDKTSGSTSHVVIHGKVDKATLQSGVSVSYDLRDVAKKVNRFVEDLISDRVTTPYEAVQKAAPHMIAFSTKVQELVDHRNKKIDDNGWVTFLDVLLKILTFGIYHYKHNLKAPQIHIPTQQDIDKALAKYQTK